MRLLSWGALVSIFAGAALFACGGNDEGDLFGNGGSGATGGYGQGGSATGGAATGGTATGGTATGGTATGGTATGGTATGGGGAPSGGGAPGGGGLPGGGGATSGGGTTSGGGVTGGGGSPSGGGVTGGGGTTSSCTSHCGSSQPVGEGCYCDGWCVTQGDCCPGYVSACETSAVACGSDVCSLVNSYCCQEWSGSSYSGSCTNKNTTCGGTVILCNGPEDCSTGQVCCGQIGTNGAFDKFSCVSASSCQYDNYQRVICGTAPSSCPTGFVCKATSYPQGYGYCGKP